MRINEIEFQNFRQFVNQRIVFSSVNNKVTIIHGQTHIGKTTLVKAMLWCLYGDQDGFRTDPALVSRDLLSRTLTHGTTVPVSVTIKLEHNGFDYTIKTSEKYVYTTGDGEGHFVRNGGLSRYMLKVPKRDGGTQTQLSNEQVDAEINSILPFNLKNYFFYDGENNKIDAISSKTNLQDAVRNIMQLHIREELVKYFAPTSKDRVVHRLESDKRAKDAFEAKDLQAQIDEFLSENEEAEEEIKNLHHEIDALEIEVAALEERISANAEAEDLQKRIVTVRQLLSKLREKRDSYFSSLITYLGSSSAFAYKGSGIGTLFTAMAYLHNDLPGRYSNLRLSQRSYGHQSADSIDEIIKKGICICGLPIHEGDDHYQHLIDQKNYVNPRDFGADLHALFGYFEGYVPNANGVVSQIQSIAIELKQTIGMIAEREKELATLSQQLGDFKGDVGQWKRDLDQKNADIVRMKTKIEDREADIKKREAKIHDRRERLGKLEAYDEFNEKINRYLAYVHAVYDRAKQSLELKKTGVAEELEKEVNHLYHAIIGSDVTELRLDPITYRVDSYQSGKRIKLSTGQETVRNLAFVGGLIYLAKHKECIGGDPDDVLDAPEDYPLILDAPFSNLNEDDIVRACTELPKYCGQLIITALEKDYRNAINALKPYLDRSYSLTTNEMSTTSQFAEDVL